MEEDSYGKQVSMTSYPKVLVIHKGARHNYALPNAFADAGMLEAFYTDACGGRGIGRLAEWLQTLPFGERLWGRAVQLVNRRVPEAVLSRTRTADLETLRYTIDWILAKGEAARFRALVADHTRRGAAMRRWGLGDATHLFNVLGEGGDLLRAARDKGVPILSDVIIALSSDKIVRREYDAFPDWGPSPPDRAASMGGEYRPQSFVLETTDVFVCPSAFVAKDLVENWGVARAATRIVPYAIPGAWFEMTPKPEIGRILFVGSADLRKGIHYFAMASDRLRAKGRSYDFRVAGDAAAAVREQKVSRDLTFLGRVPRNRIAEEFAKADVFVLPTVAEGSATVVYEALAMGIPVVTTQAAGSVVRDGLDGRIVPERDPDALADAIESIVEDRALRERFAREGRRHAGNFTTTNYAQSLIALVQEQGKARSATVPESAQARNMG